MDQRAGHTQRQIDERRAAMTENLAKVEARMQETVDGVTSTVESAMKGFRQVQDTVDSAKAAVDETLERVTNRV
jgi:hypothetical protein